MAVRLPLGALLRLNGHVRLIGREGKEKEGKERKKQIDKKQR